MFKRVPLVVVAVTCGLPALQLTDTLLPLAVVKPLGALFDALLLLVVPLEHDALLALLDFDADELCDADFDDELLEDERLDDELLDDERLELDTLAMTKTFPK